MDSQTPQVIVSKESKILLPVLSSHLLNVTIASRLSWKSVTGCQSSNASPSKLLPSPSKPTILSTCLSLQPYHSTQTCQIAPIFIPTLAAASSSYKSEFGRRSFSFAAPSIWNSIPSTQVLHFSYNLPYLSQDPPFASLTFSFILWFHGQMIDLLDPSRATNW